MNNHQSGYQLPYIDINLNGKPYKFLIDTGSTKSFIEPGIMDSKFNRKIKPTTISTLFNKHPVDEAVILKGLPEFKTKEDLEFIHIQFMFNSYSIHIQFVFNS